MAKVTVMSPEKTTLSGLPAGFSGTAATTAYLAGPNDPIHLHRLALSHGDTICIGPLAVDFLAYVWTGAVEAGDKRLGAGSSLVVEHGATLTLICDAEEAQVLVFAAAHAPARQRGGGHVHLLPEEHVIRFRDMIPGVHGAMHFDSACLTCELWLHESEFTPAFLSPETENRSPHCHTEDEIIFITDGSARLGNGLFGPGTALAIHAGTMYTFNPGPEGLRFVNFRAARPEINRRSDGTESREADGWQRRMGGTRPNYIEPQ